MTFNQQDFFFLRYIETLVKSLLQKTRQSLEPSTLRINNSAGKKMDFEDETQAQFSFFFFFFGPMLDENESSKWYSNNYLYATFASGLHSSDSSTI